MHRGTTSVDIHKISYTPWKVSGVLVGEHEMKIPLLCLQLITMDLSYSSLHIIT